MTTAVADDDDFYHSMILTECPEDGCLAPSRVVHKSMLWSTDGPVEHWTTCCVMGHKFTMPSEGLKSY